MNNGKATIKSVDIYRGLLAQYVILAHLIPALFPNILGIPGTLAVWGFFVTSGYLNALSLYANPATKNYFVRRAIRLYPLLFISYLVIGVFEHRLLINDIFTLFPFVLWIKGHMPYNGVLWTLVIELQLYLLTPFLFLILKKMPCYKNILLLSLFALPCLSIVASMAASHLLTGSIDMDDRTVFSAFPMYVFGMLLASSSKNGENLYFLGREWLLAISGVIFIVVVINRNMPSVTWDSLFYEGRFIPFILTAYCLSSEKIFSFFDEAGIMSILGKLTYEIYLFHGLFVYILFKMFDQPNPFFMIMFFWLLPIGAAFIYTLCKNTIKRRCYRE
jgi:peptidoglycan/LPS O-acetylase OafA/YrhL